MGRFRLESYSGRSIEAGSDGWEGLRNAEASRNNRDQEEKVYDKEEEMRLIREALDKVPGGIDDEPYYHSMGWTDMARDITNGPEPPSPKAVHETDEILELSDGEKEYEEFLRSMMEI